MFAPPARSAHDPVRGRRPKRAIAVVLALFVFAMIAAVGAPAASACVPNPNVFLPLPLSSFEGADGDQCDSDGVGPLRDWENGASDPTLNGTVDSTGANETLYGSNNAGVVGGPSSEIVPDSWNFTTGNLGA